MKGQSLLTNARDAHLAGDYSAARHYAKNLLRQEPSNLSALQLSALTDLAELRYEPAIAKIRSTLKRYPNDPPSLVNLAFALYNSGQDDDAFEAAHKACEYTDDPRAKFVRGMCRLKYGFFISGFRDYEARFDCGVTKLLAPKETMWNGEWLGPDKTLTLWTDQGAGDSIQMIRFVEAAKKASGAKVLLASHPETKRLFQPFAEVVSEVKAWEPHCPLFSLPRILGITLEQLEQNLMPHKLEQPTVYIKQEGPREDIGLCWSGGQSTPELRDRSIPRQRLEPLDDIDDTLDYRWRGLQYGEDGFHPKDFQETAEAIAKCNLVITIDTSVAHLAAAMGIETWVMLRYQGDFRWLRERTDSPWYASMRLFRQKRMGDWKPVVEEVRDALKERLRNA